MSGPGLYVHIPFCPQLCPYCSFAVVVGRTDWQHRYVEAVCRELENRPDWEGRGPVSTVFFGGGTPSQLPAEWVGQILAVARRKIGVIEGAEISAEANPQAADRARFGPLRQAGINRLSLGAQAFAAASLAALGRRHRVADVEAAFAAARSAGFDNLSLDLIFAVPGVPIAAWQRTIERALSLEPEHISAYGLTFEAGTVFERQRRQGRLQPVEEDDQAAQYQWAVKALAAAGYERYEVSNFARPGRRSQHNWAYWTGAEYLGVGLGAHSFVGGRRRWNARDLRRYVEAVEAGASPVAGEECLATPERRRETLYTGLRTAAGVELEPSEAAALRTAGRFADLVEAGYLVLQDHHLHLADEGYLLADALSVEVGALLDEGAPVQD